MDYHLISFQEFAPTYLENTRIDFVGESPPEFCGRENSVYAPSCVTVVIYPSSLIVAMNKN